MTTVDAEVASPEVGRPVGTTRTFRSKLGLVVIGGTLLRVGVVLMHYRRLPLGFTDNFFYSVQARAVSRGAGFVDPFIWQDTGQKVASADHPPLYTLYLSVFSLLTDGPTAHRLASCLLGAGTVAVVGLAARRLAMGCGLGDPSRVGLFAAAIAAVYPPLWIADATLVSESLYALLVAAIIWAGLGVAENPTWVRVAMLGLLVGLAALTRAEALTLGLLLIAPVGWLAGGTARERAQRVAGCGLVVLVVIAPWVVRNLQTFEEPVALSVGAGFVLRVGNCDLTYGGDRLGYWANECAYEGFDDEVDRSVHERRARAEATTYMREHSARVPVVVAARLGRLYEVFRPLQGVRLNDFFERRGLLPSYLGLFAFHIVTLGALASAWRVRRSWRALVAPASMICAATITAATAFGITRYRIGADVALVIVAGLVAARWPGPADPQSVAEVS